MLITHKQSLIMLSITCRCILYALVSVVVPWGVALGWVRMRLRGGKSTVYSLQKARLHHWSELNIRSCNRLSCLFEFKSIFIHTGMKTFMRTHLPQKRRRIYVILKVGGGGGGDISPRVPRLIYAPGLRLRVEESLDPCAEEWSRPRVYLKEWVVYALFENVN